MGFWDFVSALSILGQPRGVRTFFNGLVKVCVIILLPMLITLGLFLISPEAVVLFGVAITLALLPLSFLFRMFK